MTLYGKGYYIWKIARTESGDPSAIANLASLSNFSHVLIKIADGAYAYNLDSTGRDLVPPVLTALRERRIQVWGWHYVYGDAPNSEADIAIQRIQQLGVDGYVIDAEAQYKQPGKEEAAKRFMDRLRATLPTFPIALSSYRYPTLHSNFPWKPFLDQCDFNMPQVYWLEAHNPADQLARSLREFQNLAAPFRPMIPTGSAFKSGDWAPSVLEINDFLRATQNLNLTAANFWEWAHTRLYLPEIWSAIRDYPWPPDPANQDIVWQYISALNSHSPDQVLSLYHPQAAHVTSKRTIQGTTAIREWYVSLFSQLLPNATFSLVNFTGRLGSRQLNWTATSSAGSVLDGLDSFGLVDGKIAYHYTSFSIS